MIARRVSYLASPVLAPGVVVFIGGYLAGKTTLILVDVAGDILSGQSTGFFLAAFLEVLLLFAVATAVTIATGRLLLDGRRGPWLLAVVICGLAAAFCLYSGINWERWYSMEANRNLFVEDAGPGYESKVDRQRLELFLLFGISLIGLAALAAHRRPGDGAEFQADPARARRIARRAIAGGVAAVLVFASIDAVAERIARDVEADVLARLDRLVRWQATLDRRIRTLVATRDRLYVSGEGDLLTALDVRNGREIWRARVPGDGVHPMLTPRNDGVYVSAAARLFALDAATGARRWAYRFEEQGNKQLQFAPSVGATLVLMVASYPDALIALDRSTGKEQWRFQTQTDSFLPYRFGRPSVSDETVFVAGDRDALFALDAGNGRLRWRAAVNGWARSAPVVSRSSVYVATDRGELSAFDRKTGRRRWQADVEPSFNLVVTLVGNTVYVTGRGIDVRTIAAFEASTGAALWRREPTGTAAVPPAVDGDAIVLVDMDGHLRLIDAASGRDRSCLTLPVPAFDTALAAENDLVFHASDRTIRAIPRWEFSEEFERDVRTNTTVEDPLCPAVRPGAGR